MTLVDVIGIDYKLPVFAQYENYNPVASTVDGLMKTRFRQKQLQSG